MFACVSARVYLKGPKQFKQWPIRRALQKSDREDLANSHRRFVFRYIPLQ